MTKKLLLLIIFLVLFFLGGAYYWLVILENPIPFTETEENPSGFNPFNRQNITPPVETTGPIETENGNQVPITQAPEIPVLRLLSETPVGGMSASTTASTTLVRFVDRGAGHIFEAYSDTLAIEKISNTTLPRIYESFWNKDLSATILRYIKDGSDDVTNFYGEIRKTADFTSTTTNKTPYEVRGRFLSPNIKDISISPKKDRIFSINVEGGRGIGYVSQFDETKKVRILDTPLTQIQSFWPEENTIFISTKASGVSSGYFYSIDVRSSEIKKILGGILGLGVLPSADAKQVLFSTRNGRTVGTSLYNIEEKSSKSIIFKTLSEKCVWSTLRKNEIYCAVPTEIPDGLYPDDWYSGTISFIDQIWHLDTETGEVHLIANLLNLSDQLIDAINLSLDPKENYLYFINKNDLSLWSLDLNR